MSRIRNLVIVTVLLAGLVVSGCVSDEPAETVQIDESTQQISAADSALVNEAVGLTDAEVMDLESDMAELEALRSDMDMEENLTLEGV
ncbi:MAG: hypothetical protein P1P69_01420 [Methanosarcinaceae archaeon]|nr:hypothetical protein [Methanosarcinaceae archaeon]MDF1533147.1 hypothetical protein [Methanosarcinaceae archaeon]